MSGIPTFHSRFALLFLYLLSACLTWLLSAEWTAFMDVLSEFISQPGVYVQYGSDTYGTMSVYLNQFFNQPNVKQMLIKVLSVYQVSLLEKFISKNAAADGNASHCLPREVSSTMWFLHSCLCVLIFAWHQQWMWLNLKTCYKVGAEMLERMWSWTLWLR